MYHDQMHHKKLNFQERRNAIGAAALKLFSEFGYAAVSNKDLGKAAGVNPALIYYYFKDKDDLFQFAVRMALTDVVAAYEKLRRERKRIGGLEAWLSSNLLLSPELSGFLKVVLDYSYSNRKSPLTEGAIKQFYVTEVEILASALSRKPGIPTQRAVHLARLISVLLDGVMAARVIRPEIDARQIVDLLQELVKHRWGGRKAKG
jgi:AcrR family transcriptional regulator